MEVELSYKTDANRRLCIKKDLIELSQWIDTLSNINDDLSSLKLIEKQLLKDSGFAMSLQGIRRKNTLLMGTLCKYEQELKREYEYGKKEYDLTRAKVHEKKRDVHTAFIEEFRQLKRSLYHKLSKYQRR